MAESLVFFDGAREPTDGFEPSDPREKDGEKAEEAISQLTLAGSVNAAGTRCLHFGKMRVQASGNSFPAYKREASPTDADGRQDHHACG
jgi:hypothetical protein